MRIAIMFTYARWYSGMLYSVAHSVVSPEYLRISDTSISLVIGLASWPLVLVLRTRMYSVISSVLGRRASWNTVRSIP